MRSDLFVPFVPLAHARGYRAERVALTAIAINDSVRKQPTLVANNGPGSRLLSPARKRGDVCPRYTMYDS